MLLYVVLEGHHLDSLWYSMVDWCVTESSNRKWAAGGLKAGWLVAPKKQMTKALKGLACER